MKMPNAQANHQFLGRNQLTEYFVDAGQRTILFWDTIRQRGNQYLEHMARETPHVLRFEYDLILDGRTLPGPVNYGLVKMRPPKDVAINDRSRPFVIIDPRAGHGPGIGGFKADSEIGVAMSAGHPCYFIGFSAKPQPGQTIEAVMRAERAFLKRVNELHPEAEGKPVVIGNCQAGWAVMMLAATSPDLCGPIIVAGAPLSYWAGVRGQNPMRYTGGMLGGSWLTALISDSGKGIFDGAWLVQNFEGLNPANTLWSKQYNLFANIDSEASRYLGFERWWGGHVLLGGEEIQYIVDNLFIGNKLSSAELITSDEMRIDLRNIRSPIVCFCSKGDNITPPPASVGLDPRPLPQRGRYSHIRPDDHLRRARARRPSGHLCFGRRCQERAQRVCQQHRFHRLHAARTLRGGHRKEIGRHRAFGAGVRALRLALRAAHPG
jgi:pimeloyl-ACP methyl ester carboxylesterase